MPLVSDVIIIFFVSIVILTRNGQFLDLPLLHSVNYVVSVVNKLDDPVFLQQVCTG